MNVRRSMQTKTKSLTKSGANGNLNMGEMLKGASLKKQLEKRRLRASKEIVPENYL